MAAAGILPRVRVPDRQDAVGHLEQRIADPAGEVGVQRAKTQLGISGGHGSFKRSRSMHCLSDRLVACLASPNRPVALHDAQPLRVVDAGHQVDDIDLAVVQAAQHRPHLGERSLVAAYVQRDGCQVHHADGAVLVIFFAALALDDLEPHVIQRIFAGRVDQTVPLNLEVIGNVHLRLFESLLQARQDCLRSPHCGRNALVNPIEEIGHIEYLLVEIRKRIKPGS